ncbi:peptide synthetase, partial [Bacillus cereus]
KLSSYLTNRYCDGQHQFNFADNAFMSRFKFMLQYGVVTKDLFSDKIEFTPVDDCSKIIMKFVTADRINKYDNDCVFHIYNHKKVGLENMLSVLNTLGYAIKLLSSDEYRELVLKLSQDINKQKDIRNLMALGNLDKDNNKTVMIDSMKTQAKLKKLDTEWVTINEEYLEKIICYMISSNYINLNPVTNV